MHAPQRDAEDGFTMIELMVVVLIIGILIAIALPTFLGARSRAQDRAAMVDIRNAFTAERAFYTEGARYTEDPTELETIEPALDYQTGDTPAAIGPVYVHVHPIPNEVFLSGRSASGTCFYIREIDGGGVAFATSPGCGVADVQAFASSW
jgi:type IV pilus assembly protein PilA